MTRRQGLIENELRLPRVSCCRCQNGDETERSVPSRSQVIDLNAAFLKARAAAVLVVCAAIWGGTALAAEKCDLSKLDAGTIDCMKSELRTLDRAINDLYGSLVAARDAAGKKQLRQQQRDWLSHRDSLCHLGSAYEDRESWLRDLSSDNAKMVCVVTLTRLRVAALSALQSREQTSAQTSQAPAAAAVAASRPGPQYDVAYDKRAATVHSTGKWYFEIVVNRGVISTIFPTNVLIGLSDKEQFTGTSENISGASPSGESVNVGIAADLDNGKLYVRRNGAWQGGEPGSNRGNDVKLGRAYYSVIIISAKEHNSEYYERGGIVPNFGGARAMTYALPDGYVAWRDSPSGPAVG